MKQKNRLIGTFIGLTLTVLQANAQFQFEQVLPGQGADFELSGNNAVAFSDIDGDGDEDVIISGFTGVSQSTNLYLNDGGSFTLVENTPYPGTVAGTIDFSDIDGDGDEDMVMCGMSGDIVLEASTRLYINTSGSFTEVENTGLENSAFGVPLFADIDNDGDEDLLITGVNQSGESFSNLYSNDGGTFTWLENMDLQGAIQSTAAFADIEGDGDLDLVISGYELTTSAPSTNLYRNENGVFSLVEDIDLVGIRSGAVVFSDVDNDGDQDLFIIGSGSTENAALLYLNEAGDFTLSETNSFAGLSTGDALFGDLDGDGDEDLIISGTDAVVEEQTLFYSNEEGSFTLVENLPFANLQQTTINFSDVDNDDDLDVLLTGVTFLIGNEVSLYLNNTPQGPMSLTEARLKPFRVAPNPTSGITRLDLSESQKGPYVLTVFSVAGNAVHQEILNGSSKSVEVDLSRLVSGAYILSLQSSNGERRVSKLIVE
jgi:hypothetical protein